MDFFNPSQDRRRWERAKVELPVQYVLEQELTNGYIKDIGGGGVKLQTPQPIPDGSYLILQFALEEKNNSVIVKGKPVWRRESGGHFETGIEFTDIPEEERNNIIDYVKAKQKSSIK